jgi:hypothetical protein
MNVGLMVRALSKRPNHSEGPAATRELWRSSKKKKKNYERVFNAAQWARFRMEQVQGFRSIVKWVFLSMKMGNATYYV